MNSHPGAHPEHVARRDSSSQLHHRPTAAVGVPLAAAESAASSAARATVAVPAVGSLNYRRESDIDERPDDGLVCRAAVGPLTYKETGALNAD